MTDVYFPRVLVVSAASINHHSATGITMINLFSGWPLDKIAQIYDDITAPDDRYCKRSRRFSSVDIPLIKTAKRLVNKLRLIIGNAIHAESKIVSPTPSGSVSYGFLGACGDVMPFSLSNGIIEWLDEYKPEVIYSVLGSVRMMNITLQLSRRFAIPIVPHFMDDWPNTAYVKSWLLFVPRLVLERKLKKVLSRSPVGLTIGSDMAVEFAGRYGRNFDCFMNCVEINTSSSEKELSNAGTVVFAFVGGLHLNRWKSLLAVASALEELKCSGVNLSVEIYSPVKDLQLYDDIFREFSVVTTMSTMMACEVNEKLRSFDVLIHVESFLREDSFYTRYSISTKIPQYMASGRPILAYGPGCLSSIRYIKRTETGLVTERENDAGSLRAAIISLVESPNLRTTLGERGRCVAAKNHNAALERSRFHSVLADTAGKGVM